MNKLNNIFSTFSFNFYWNFFLYSISSCHKEFLLQLNIPFILAAKKFFSIHVPPNRTTLNTAHKEQREIRATRRWKERRKTKRNVFTVTFYHFIDMKRNKTEIYRIGIVWITMSCYYPLLPKHLSQKNTSIHKTFLFLLLVLDEHAIWSGAKIEASKKRRTKIKKWETFFRNVFF